MSTKGLICRKALDLAVLYAAQLSPAIRVLGRRSMHLLDRTGRVGKYI